MLRQELQADNEQCVLESVFCPLFQHLHYQLDCLHDISLGTKVKLTGL